MEGLFSMRPTLSTFKLNIGQSGGASVKMIGYQQGYPVLLILILGFFIPETELTPPPPLIIIV